LRSSSKASPRQISGLGPKRDLQTTPGHGGPPPRIAGDDTVIADDAVGGAAVARTIMRIVEV
jgi:hypothetical protein